MAKPGPPKINSYGVGFKLRAVQLIRDAEVRFIF